MKITSGLATIALLAIFAVSPPGLADAMEMEEEGKVEVTAPDTFVYSKPDTTSQVYRRLYPGEIVLPVKEVVSEDGRAWLEIELGSDLKGYVKKDRVRSVGRFARAVWRKSTVVRDERPVSLGAKLWGETFGATLNLRLMPFSRLGMTLGLGPVMDGMSAKGMALTWGIQVVAALTNLSPVAELGISRVSYHDEEATMTAISFYLTLGIEWMADWGGYIFGGATFIRSVDMSVSVSYRDARDGEITVGDYGMFQGSLEGDVLQMIQPNLAVGYAF